MSLSKREFLQVLASASVAGMGLGRYADADAATAEAGPVRPAAASATSACCT
jgi:sulfur-oxidizing protein SoxB